MKLMISIPALLLSSAALAEPMVIAAGKEGGGYDALAQKAATKLEQRGYEASVQNLNGSDEITLAICAGRAIAGPTQIDAIDARASEGCNLEPIATYGDGEMAMIFFPPDSDFNELDDLGAENSILVDTIGSGTSLFWDTIVRIETGEDGNKSAWSSAKPVNEFVSMANTLSEFGDIDAVIMVRTYFSDDIDFLLKQGWQIGELYDKDINDYQFRGTSLYEPTKIRENVGGYRLKGYGYRVKSFVVVDAATKRDRQTYTDLAKAFQ